MPRPLTIACLQTRPMPDFETAISEALGLAEKAVGQEAEFLALPEYCGGLVTEGAAIKAPAAEEDAHPVLNAFADFARANKVWIMAGSVAVPGPDGTIINRGVVIDPAGRHVTRYDKIHMFDIQLSEDEVYRESAYVSPGSEARLVPTDFGVVGHTICYDLRFPALYRDLAQAGAEILAVPAAFTKKTGEAHWHVLNRARAIENGCFVVAPCAHGAVPGGGEAYGHSLIIDPWGVVLADGGEGAGLAIATIDLDDVAAARGRIPSLGHDRRYVAPAKPAQAAE
ncbi:carbon-nitrogen hydrolase family protein [Rhodobacteraceae bacterium NNCM2]|nr:carbon-nitrogen hydrolase family protein [Coraliihabitans acroporae]